MIGHGMGKNPIDFGGGHLGFGAAILDLVENETGYIMISVIMLKTLILPKIQFHSNNE